MNIFLYSNGFGFPLLFVLQCKSDDKMFLLFWPFHGRLVVWTASCSQVVRHLALSWNFFVFFWQAWILLHFAIVAFNVVILKHSSTQTQSLLMLQCDRADSDWWRLLLLCNIRRCWWRDSAADMQCQKPTWKYFFHGICKLLPEFCWIHAHCRELLWQNSPEIFQWVEHTERTIRQVVAQFNLFIGRSPGRPLY